MRNFEFILDDMLEIAVEGDIVFDPERYGLPVEEAEFRRDIDELDVFGKISLLELYLSINQRRLEDDGTVSDFGGVWNSNIPQGYNEDGERN
jgi:hypothetical protein